MRKLRWADLVQGIWKRGGTTASISTVRRLSENVKSHLGHLSQAITIDKSRYRKVSQAEISCGKSVADIYLSNQFSCSKPRRNIHKRIGCICGARIAGHAPIA